MKKFGGVLIVCCHAKKGGRQVLLLAGHPVDTQFRPKEI